VTSARPVVEAPVVEPVETPDASSLPVVEPVETRDASGPPVVEPVETPKVTSTAISTSSITGTPPVETPIVPPLKHTQIAQALGEEIRTGRVRHGRRLPGEKALAARFSVSRNTVRAALQELSREGMIATRSGKGSYVIFDGRPLDGQLGWARSLQAQGIRSEIAVLRIERVSETDEAASVPGAAVRGGASGHSASGHRASDLIAVDRVRRIVGGPAVSYERSRVPAIPALADLPARGLVDGSIAQTVIAAGLLIHSAEQWMGARPLTGEEAEVLGREPGELFLYATRVTRTRKGELVERVEAVLDPAYFELHFQLDQG
jgi:GntR family transcriptional regulator